MEKLEFLKSIVEALKAFDNPSIKLSLNNVHAEGLFSLVVSGTEHGKLTRVFIADKRLNPFEVQLHTHRYPLRITAIKGIIKHHLAERVSVPDFTSISIPEYEYKSFLNGGFGLKYMKNTDIKCSDFIIPLGASINMGIQDFHTVSCSKGSIWIVEEQGFETHSSIVLGIPFVVDSLYSEPAMFQLNDKRQLVIREVKKIIQNYELV